MKDFFIPALFLVGTLFFAYLYIDSPEGQKDPVIKREKGLSRGSSSNYGKLQQYQQELRVKKDILKQQAELQKTKDKPELDPNYLKRNRFHETRLNDGIDPAAIDLEDGGYEEPMTLDQRMNAFLAKKQEYDMLEQAERQTYVQTFIQEAYKMGYIVKVNEDMEVVDVKAVDEN